MSVFAEGEVGPCCLNLLPSQDVSQTPNEVKTQFLTILNFCTYLVLVFGFVTKQVPTQKRRKER